MGEKYQALVAHLQEIQNLNRAASVLGWDQQTMMPHSAAESRGATLATLAKLAHEKFTSDETARLLEDARGELNGADYESEAASVIRVTQADYDDEVKIPSHLVAEFSRLTTIAHNHWAEARAASDYRKFQPTLEKLFEMTRQMADHLGWQETPYDALLNRYERGANSRTIRAIFDDLRKEQVALVKAIAGSGKSNNASKLLHQHFDIDAQRKFGEMVVSRMGFDFSRGRQDVAVHPFCTNFGRNDVRLTTRFDENFLNPALFGTIHEAGHGMYEQGSPEEIDHLPIAGGTSLGVHESQSRMWENIVARSRNFWVWALPHAQKLFPAQFANVSVDDVYRAVNTVEPSLIRVEADEATYNLHIMLRFELEIEMIEGKIDFNKLPQIWNERFEEYLGIVPPNDAKGVLQDVHWSMGLIGYFATYSLGNLLSAQYYQKALQAHPQIPDEIAEGKFDTLLNWLRENIHQHGRKFTSDELTRRVTGEGIQTRDYLAYLKGKYGEIYGV
jgi:carboxypeptidase Taq